MQQRFIMQNGRRFVCYTRKFVIINITVLSLFIVLLIIIRSIIEQDLGLSLVLPSVFHLRLARSKPPDWLNGSASIQVEPTGFVVDTPSCRIPDFDAFNPSISPYVHDPAPGYVNCSHSLPVTFTDRQYIRLNKTLALSLVVQQCFYQRV